MASDDERSRSSRGSVSRKDNKKDKKEKKSRNTDPSDLEAMFAKFSKNVNENTNKQFASVKETMEKITTKVETIEKEVGEVKQEVNELKTWRTDMEKDMKKLQEDVAAGPAIRQRAGDEPMEEASSSSRFAPYPPPWLRKTVIIGMFDEDTPRDDIINAMKAMVNAPTTVKDYIVPGGKYSNKGKVEFTTPKTMWAWVTANAGKKLVHEGKELWFAVDKPLEERIWGKRVGKVVTEMRGFYERRGDVPAGDRVALKKFVDPDNRRGSIFLWNPDTSKMQKAVNKKEDHFLEKVWQPALEGLDLEAIVGQANLITE